MNGQDPVKFYVTDSYSAITGTLTPLKTRNRSIWFFPHDVVIIMRHTPDRERKHFLSKRVVEHSQMIDLVSFLRFIKSTVSDSEYISSECELLANRWNAKNGSIEKVGERTSETTEFIINSRTWSNQGKPEKTELVLQLTTFSFNAQMQDKAKYIHCYKNDVTIGLKYRSTVRR